MSAATQAADLVDVTVAFGRCIVDAAGEQRLAGETAQVAAADVPGLVASGFAVDPADKPGEKTTRQNSEAARIASNLGRLVQGHLIITAFGLRPNQDGGLLRAQQFLKSLDDLRKQGEQLVHALTPEGDGQPA